MGFLTTAIVVGAVAQGASQVISAQGQRRAANDIIKEGNRLGADAILRGEEQAERYQRELSGILGRQRAVMAASNVDADVGSAAQVTEQTERFGAEDVETIRRNALREAYGLKRDAQMQARAMRSAATAGMIAGGSTLITAGIDAWGAWQRRGLKVPALQPGTVDRLRSEYRPTTTVERPRF